MSDGASKIDPSPVDAEAAPTPGPAAPVPEYAIILGEREITLLQAGQFIFNGQPTFVLHQFMFIWHCPHEGCGIRVAKQPGMGKAEMEFVLRVMTGRMARHHCDCGARHRVTLTPIRTPDPMALAAAGLSLVGT